MSHVTTYCFILYRSVSWRTIARCDRSFTQWKKTAQTLQDSKWYDVSRLFGTVPIDRSRLFDVARALEADGFISRVDEHIYCTTASGKEKLRHFILPPHIDGWKYMNESSLFWKRLSLLI